jgi:hypothetical protein
VENYEKKFITTHWWKNSWKKKKKCTSQKIMKKKELAYLRNSLFSLGSVVRLRQLSPEKVGIFLTV